MKRDGTRKEHSATLIVQKACQRLALKSARGRVYQELIWTNNVSQDRLKRAQNAMILVQSDLKEKETSAGLDVHLAQPSAVLDFV